MAKLSNQEYWAKRKADAQTWIADNLKSDADFQKLLLSKYKDAAKMMQAEIDREYRAYAQHENLDISDAMGAVADEDVQSFAEEAAQLVNSKDFSPEANARLKLYNATMRINRLEYLKAQMGMQMLKATAGAEADINDKTAQAYSDECKRQSGILSEYADDFDFSGIIKNIAKQYNPEGFSKNIWKNQDVIKAKLDQQLTQAMTRGLNPRRIARELAPAVKDAGVSASYAAERIARTEMARAQNQAQLDSFEANGIEKVIWVAEPGACEICKPRDDKSYKREDVPELPAHPNCRCALSADPDWASVDDEIDKYLAEHGEERPRAARAPKSGSLETRPGFRKRMGSLGFTDLNLGKIDPETMRAVSRTISDFYKENPEMRGYLKSLNVYDDPDDITVASAGFNDEEWNKAHLVPQLNINSAALKGFSATLREMTDIYWWTKKSDYTGIIKHELAHAIHQNSALVRSGLRSGDQLDMRNPRDMQKWSDAADLMNGHKIDSETMQEAFKRAKIPYDKEHVAGEISRYGVKNPAEAFAEAMSNEDSENTITKQVKQIVKKELKEIAGSITERT